MAIVKMKKLRLLAVSSQRDELLRDLMILGCVEVSETSAKLDDPEWAAIAHKEETDLVQRRNDHAELALGLKTLDKYAPAKTKPFSPLAGGQPY